MVQHTAESGLATRQSFHLPEPLGRDNLVTSKIHRPLFGHLTIGDLIQASRMRSSKLGDRVVKRQKKKSIA